MIPQSLTRGSLAEILGPMTSPAASLRMDDFARAAAEG